MLLKFTFLALTLATSSALGECPANANVPAGVGCDPSPNICEVKCPAEESCVLSEGCAGALVTDDQITHTQMTKEKCQELCKASDENGDATRCRFWRYVSCLHFAKRSMTFLKKHQELISNDEEVCSLMSSSQCTVPEVCTETSCSTGDVGCPDGEMPDPDTGLGCPGKMEFHTDPGYIHWGCVNEVADISSPYDQDAETMPANTLCTTSQR